MTVPEVPDVAEPELRYKLPEALELPDAVPVRSVTSPEVMFA